MSFASLAGLLFPQALRPKPRLTIKMLICFGSIRFLLNELTVERRPEDAEPVPRTHALSKRADTRDSVLIARRARGVSARAVADRLPQLLGNNERDCSKIEPVARASPLACCLLAAGPCENSVLSRACV
jgi:hypothetical protein